MPFRRVTSANYISRQGTNTKPDTSRLIAADRLTAYLTEKSITKTDRDRLRLAIIRQRGLTKLSPDAALLVAAERERVMQHVVLVDPNGAGPQGVADADGGVEAGGVDGAGEAVGGRVAETDGVFFRLEFGDRADGTEDFFLHYLHVFRDAGEDGRLDEVALFAVALAADFHFRALFPAGVNVSALALVYRFGASYVWKVYPMIRSYCSWET